MSCSYSPTCSLNRYTEREKSLNFYFKHCIQIYLAYSCCVSHIVSYTVKSLSLYCIEYKHIYRIKYAIQRNHLDVTSCELQGNGGHEHFLLSPEIANPRTVRLIPLFEIRKIFRFCKTTNPQLF